MAAPELKLIVIVVRTLAAIHNEQIVAELETAAGDGGDEHDLVSVLEGVGFAAEEADVFVVDVDVDEATKFSRSEERRVGKEC